MQSSCAKHLSGMKGFVPVQGPVSSVGCVRVYFVLRARLWHLMTTLWFWVPS